MAGRCSVSHSFNLVNSVKAIQSPDPGLDWFFRVKQDNYPAAVELAPGSAVIDRCYRFAFSDKPNSTKKKKADTCWCRLSLDLLTD